MRNRLVAAVSVLSALLFACAGADKTPVLTISPSGAVNASGPTLFTASPTSLASGVTWTLDGPGTLSGTSGGQVTYRPPAFSSSNGNATVTAHSGSQTATATITLALPPSAAPGHIASLTGAVSVTNDAQGIPHIFCGPVTDCFAVQGYLQAQDRLFQMDLFRRTARGTVSGLIGPLEISSDMQFLAFFATRDGKRIEDQLAAALDADTRAKLTAFASGVNAYLSYLAAHPTLMPGEYAQLPFPITPADIPQWTPQDTLAIGRLQQFQLSETLSKENAYGVLAAVFNPATDPRFTAYVRQQQPVKAYTLAAQDLTAGNAPETSAVGEVTPAGLDLAPWKEHLITLDKQLSGLRHLFGSLREGAGSNNWVVDAAHSATGKAMVANDPHLALQYPPLFHLSALTASDGSGYNLIGGAFPGIPGALIGRGAHVGWGVTVVGYDVTDIYLEKLTNCSGTGATAVCGSVSFKGADVPLTFAQFDLPVRGSAGVVSQRVTIPIVPHHGPIISFDPAHGTAVSMRWTGHEVTADLKAFLALGNANSVGTLDGSGNPSAGSAFAALRDYAVGAQNFVLADDAGNIGYDPHALVPKRPAIGPTNAPWLPLRGDDGLHEWGSGVDADHCAGTVTSGTLPTRNCWIDDAKLPQSINPAKGYLATANSDPAGYTDLAANTGLASAGYLSFDWDDPTAIRYARIAELLKAKTTAPAKVSEADMEAIQSDHAIKLASLFEPFFVAATTLPTAQQAPYAAARAMLTTWAADGYDCPTGLVGVDPKGAIDPDPKHSRDSAACLLFHTFLRQLLKNVYDDDFAFLRAASGQSFSADFGPEIRGLIYMLGLPANDPGASFCNDVNTSGTKTASHSCAQQLTTALLGAQTTLAGAYGTATTNWIWGRVHTLTTTSPASPLIEGPFAAGPFARPGGAGSVDVGNPDGSQSSPLGMTYSHGSNVRWIAVMTDAASAVSKMQLPGPQHDGPQGLFANSPDLLGLYVRNQYFDFAYGHQIDAGGVSSQGFTAQ